MGILSRLFGKNGTEKPSPEISTNMVVPPEGDPIIANYKDTGKYKSCVIDKSGRKVIEVPYPDSALIFQDGMCSISPGGTHARYRFINKKGEIVGTESYYSANAFSEGLAAVAKSENEWGFIDKTGNTIIPFIYSSAGDFNNGLASVRRDGNYKWGFINKKGKTVIPHTDAWKQIKKFSENMCPVKIGDKWGFINDNGRLVIAPRFDDVGLFSEGLARAKSEDKWGYIDKGGQWVIKNSFSYAGDFSESLAHVYPSRYIDLSGNTVIDFADWEKTPDGLSRFREGLAAVCINEKWGFINKKGDVVIPFEYGKLGQPEFSEGLVGVTKDEKECYINKGGELVINTDANYASLFKDGLACLVYFKERQISKNQEEKEEQVQTPSKQDSMHRNWIPDRGTTVFAFKAFTPEAAAFTLGKTVLLTTGSSDLDAKIRREARCPEAEVKLLEPGEWNAPQIPGLAQNHIIAAYPQVITQAIKTLSERFGIKGLSPQTLTSMGAGAMPHPTGHVLFLFKVPGRERE